ncbi:MAG: GNAT family N-acetyltransferase [Oryzihumus sp.]
MTAHPRIEPLTASDQFLVENLWQCYQHDLSEFRGSLPGPDGRYMNSRVATYLASRDRSAFLIKVDEAPAGFVMIREDDDTRVLGEFFVVRPLRRQGVGRTVATDVLNSHPGRWELAFQEANQQAGRFWTDIATRLAGNTWTVAPRPVPERPDSPPDLWLTFEVGRATASSS